MGTYTFNDPTGVTGETVTVKTTECLSTPIALWYAQAQSADISGAAYGLSEVAAAIAALNAGKQTGIVPVAG